MWKVEAKSESGDDYGELGSFKEKPTDDQLRHLTHYDQIGDDGWSDTDYPGKKGPGAFGSWLHLDVYDVDSAYIVDIEVHVVPEGGWEGVYVNGTCASQGHYSQLSEWLASAQYPMTIKSLKTVYHDGEEIETVDGLATQFPALLTELC
jgi:hypothetical protein